MDRGSPDVSSLRIETEALLDFVDELREADYHIGIEHYVAAQDVVLALAAQGERLDQPDRLRSLLGPLLCSTPKEQEDFKERFDAWAGRLIPGLSQPINRSARAAGAGLEAGADQRKRRRPPWAWALATLGSLALVAGFLWWRGAEPPGREYRPPEPGIGQESPEVPPEGRPPESEPAPPPQSSPESQLPQSRPARTTWLVSSILLAALLASLWHYRGRLYLARWALAEQPEIHPIAVEGLEGELFHGVSLARTARDLRRRKETPVRDLDVSATIDETVRQGGFFTPVHGTRQVVPEYLVLVDRTNYRDQLAKLVDELLSRLRMDGVLITRYFFDADPRICFPFAEGASPLDLRELGTRYPDHDLLIFSDAAGLFSVRTGELSHWVRQFSSWRQRAILTPVATSHWGSRESALIQQFAVLPATPAGLAHLVRRVGRETSAAHHETAAAPFPRSLEERPLRWLDRRAPDDSVVEGTLASVRRYLGEGGFYWLRACAVYPELDWNLTVYLGNVLRSADGRRLLELRRLAALARLPWLRHGYMPDWLRSRLLRTLSREQQQKIRSALNGLLRTAIKSSAGGFTLPIAREMSALRSFFGMGREKSPLRDHVFVTFMAGRLALPLPHLLSNFLRPLATQIPPLAPKALRVAGIVALLVAGFLAIRSFRTVPVERGTLILDAVPWAETTRIVDVRGDPVPLAETTCTPFVLELEPGTYKVTLENPDYPTRIITVEIDASGVTTPPPVELGEVDIDRYFQDVGLAAIIEEDAKKYKSTEQKRDK